MMRIANYVHTSGCCCYQVYYYATTVAVACAYGTCRSLTHSGLFIVLRPSLRFFDKRSVPYTFYVLLLEFSGINVLPLGALKIRLLAIISLI